MSVASDPGLAPRTLVLTADDALRAAFAKLLQARGYRLEFAATLPSTPCYGLRLAVVDDRCLVDERALRAVFTDPDTLILAVTADEGRAAALLAGGAMDFLLRPFSPAGLSARLEAVERTLALLGRRHAAEAEARESHRTLATLISNLPGIVFRCLNDREWPLEFMSAGCLEITGYSAESFVSGPISYASIIHPDDREAVWDAVQQGVAERRPYRTTYRVRTARGEDRWLWEQGQGVYDPAGGLIAIEGFINDITALRRAQLEIEEREVLLETLLAVTTSAYVLCDELGQIVYVNLAAQTWLKAPDVRLIGAVFAEVLADQPSELREAIARGRDALFTVERPGSEFEAYHLVQRGVQMGGRPHTAYTVKQLTHELARQEVEVWKKVLRLIAHEIGNTLAPITSLLHSARLINAAEARDARLDRIIDTIEERAKHLGEFLRGYTQFARLPQPRIEALKWRSLFDRLIDFVRFELIASPTDLNAMAHIDRSQIEQALINLLKNAVEAGGTDSGVAVRLARAEGGYDVQVLDRGPGIPPALMSKVLLPFYSTKRTGSGLGLALCREIVEAHGGSLRIEAREGGGTIVTCWLPDPPTA
ncbi:ATP-binding protein [Nannocystis sp.]|uniref:ATP-binding protein n=1 Tax=Nannocystis sp. TaxID=1962667 RepID=UPI0025EE7282|nr:ATP-binding protein [Nannocystis sp.]MBK7826750.1 PAS domain-containing protein [Nannocystis sp.]